MITATRVPDDVRKEIWERYAIKNEKLSSICREKGVTYNQGREVIRLYRHGNRTQRKDDALLQVRVNTMEIRLEVLEKLNEIIKQYSEEDVKAVLTALHSKLILADSVDRYEGRGTPHTQINILQVRTEKKMDEIMRWVASNLPPDKNTEFANFLEGMEKSVDAEYRVVNESG